jgi:hypothetical protein
MRFFGVVGYSEGTSETVPGVYEESIVEYSYYGDVIRNARHIQEDQSINPTMTVSNSISVVADQYANEHFSAIRYVKWAGTLWTVSDVEVQRPRLILRLGGVYNGPTAP